ncbi:hypothetical protein [Marinomonas sp.]
MMKFVTAVSMTLASLLVMADTELSNATSAEQVIGSAYDVKTKALLYTEHHQAKTSHNYGIVYKDPKGQVFATKTIDFSESSITPSFQQTNDRLGEKISVQPLEVGFEVTYQQDRKSPQQQKQLGANSAMVIDAGFDGVIKQRWQALTLGEAVDVDFLAPTELRTFRFRFKQTDCLEDTALGATCFSLSPRSWLVKLAVSPIIVAYNSEQQLIRFTGRSNICDESGKYHTADIHYQYL